MAGQGTFWQGRRVLVTGHTGFKGAWLSLWLKQLGAEVTGYALLPPSNPSLFEALGLAQAIRHVHGDIRDQAALAEAMRVSGADTVFHLAAQSLVRPSYRDPVETYDVNVMGSLKVLECVRRAGGVKAVVMVTTDKCYRNNEWAWGYREIDPLGGHDPYSSSKGAMELMVDSYRSSYFPASTYTAHGTAVATVRAGNVIGGGDWSEDRLVPDLVRAFSSGGIARIRNRHAIRPWQHVLQPLRGYLTLAERLAASGPAYAEAWNFGPSESDCRPVGALAKTVMGLWGEANLVDETEPDAPHEAHFLKLDSAKAQSRLGWRPSCGLEEALRMTVEWYRVFYQGGDVRSLSLSQIDRQTLPPHHAL